MSSEFFSEITLETLRELKKKFKVEDWNDREFLEWYRTHHGTGYEIHIVPDTPIKHKNSTKKL